MEILYLAVTHLLYTMAASSAQHVFSGTAIWDVSIVHSLKVLEFEELSAARFLFPLRELSLQHWFLQHHPWLLWGLSEMYLLQIPITIT